jgi:type II secretory pathway component PulF
MQLKLFLTISSVLSAAMLAALFVLQAVMPGMADRWVNQGTDLGLVQKILIGVAAFWSRFWRLALPFVIGAVFSIVGVIALLQAAYSKWHIKLEPH